MLAQALRGMKHDPATSLTVVLSLAIGVAASGGSFASVAAAFLAPLPLRGEESLFVVRMRDPERQNPEVADAAAPFVSYSLFQTWRHELGGAPQSAGRMPVTLDLTLTGNVERLTGALVSDDYFEMLGVSPLIGQLSSRALTDDPLQCALGFETWRALFAGAPDVIGRSVTLGGQSLRVAAVLPRDFSRWATPDAFWVPIGAAPLFFPRAVLDSEGYLTTEVFLRAGNGVPRTLIQEKLTRMLRAADSQAERHGTVAEVLPLRARNRDPARGRTALLLQAAGLLTLMLGFMNATNALVARSLSRMGENAVRAALGASAGDFVRQEFVAAAVLVIPAVASGMLLLPPLVTALQGLSSNEAVSLDWRAFLFVAFLALPLIFALAVAARSTTRRVDIADVLNRHSANRGGKLSLRARRLFIVGQVALAMTILILTTALTISAMRIERRDLGFRVLDTYGARLTIPRERYDATGLLLAYREFQQRLISVPGITAAGVGSTVPFASQASASVWMEDGRRVLSGEAHPPRLHRVTRAYLQVLDIPVVAGREFDDSEPNVALVSETMAHTLWPGRMAVGQRFKLDRADKDWIEIVGVVDDTRFGGAREAARPDLYVPIARQPSNSFAIVLRIGPGFTGAAFREAVRAQDPAATVRGAGRLLDLARATAETTLRLRRATVMLALASLLLVVAGVHAISSITVRARARDIGIRIALGADRRALWADVLGSIAKPTIAGLAIGWLLGLAAMRMAVYALYEVRPTDALPGFLAAVLILAATLGAGVPAALKAVRIDPLDLLKSP